MHISFIIAIITRGRDAKRHDRVARFTRCYSNNSPGLGRARSRLASLAREYIPLFFGLRPSHPLKLSHLPRTWPGRYRGAGKTRRLWGNQGCHQTHQLQVNSSPTVTTKGPFQGQNIYYTHTLLLVHKSNHSITKPKLTFVCNWFFKKGNVWNINI